MTWVRKRSIPLLSVFTNLSVVLLYSFDLSRLNNVLHFWYAGVPGQQEVFVFILSPLGITDRKPYTVWVSRFVWILSYYIFPQLRPRGSLLAEAPFPLYSLSWRTRRKATSAMGRNSLWSNRRPRSWMAVSETHAPCIVCWPWLEPTVSRAFLHSYSAVI